MSVGQVALAAGQVLLIVFGSVINDYAVYVIALHVSRQHYIVLCFCIGPIKTAVKQRMLK
jgi:hypothetical protein